VAVCIGNRVAAVTIEHQILEIEFSVLSRPADESQLQRTEALCAARRQACTRIGTHRLVSSDNAFRASEGTAGWLS